MFNRGSIVIYPTTVMGQQYLYVYETMVKRKKTARTKENKIIKDSNFFLIEQRQPFTEEEAEQVFNNY